MSCPCIPGPVESTITWADYEAALKAYLTASGVALPSDDVLEAQLEAATRTADGVLGCTFDCDCDGVLVIPKSVILGVYAWVQSSVQGDASGGSTAGTVQSIKTGDLSVTYGGGGYNVTSAALNAAMRFWRPYICNPLR